MKQHEDRRAEREAREHIAAHGKVTTHHESALTRYLSAFAYTEAKPPAEPPERRPREEPRG